MNSPIQYFIRDINVAGNKLPAECCEKKWQAKARHFFL